jgi:DNA-binding CsgD family transcriptional regulator
MGRVMSTQSSKASHGEITFEAETGLLDALVHPAVVLDCDGFIRSVNAAWRAQAAQSAQDAAGFVGWNYIDVCLSARGPWDNGADEVAAGLKAVLKGERSAFTFTYPCPMDGEPHWYQLTAGPIRRDGEIAAVLLQHVDVTRSATDELDELTPREKAILMGIVAGLSNKQIARRDDVSESAVKLHLRNIFQKLRVSNRTQAAMRGERLMLVGSEALDGDTADVGGTAGFPPGE